MKPNKKTWIYGRGARAKRSPHFPPVVPWISPELRDELADLIVAGVTHRRDDTASEIGHIEEQIAALAGQPVLTAVERRRLHQLRKRRDQMETRSQLAGIRDKALRDVLNFSLIRGIRSVRIEVHGENPHIVFNTSPITINGTILGTYDVYFDPREETPANAFDLQRRDRQFVTGVHPHWSGGGPCLGTFGPMLHQVLKKHDISAAVGMFMNYLAIYDGYSPLITLRSFRRGSYANQHPLA